MTGWFLPRVATVGQQASDKVQIDVAAGDEHADPSPCAGDDARQGSRQACHTRGLGEHLAVLEQRHEG